MEAVQRKSPEPVGSKKKPEQFPESLLRVRHTATYKKEPLACMNLPGADAELTPAAMRSLAEALFQAANDCEALQTQVLRHGATTREYPVSPAVARSCL